MNAHRLQKKSVHSVIFQASAAQLAQYEAYEIEHIFDGHILQSPEPDHLCNFSRLSFVAGGTLLLLQEKKLVLSLHILSGRSIFLVSSNPSKNKPC
jgi:hypothetical protein